ncbi:MAG: acyloxyacyl hydrolase [Amphiplicatus sp.]
MHARLFAAALVAATPATAAAEILSELRVGVAAHAIDINGGEPTAEEGADISLETVFASPKFFLYILSPRPYAGASFNTSGGTDFWSAGLIWEQSFLNDRFFVEGDFGLAWHNGEIDLPPESDPDYDDILENNILFGSRTLFHAGAGVGVKLTPHWRVQAFYEHLSNGRIFGDTDRNQGLDNFGVRIGYRFGGE